MRFVEDNWESPVLGAWGLGWEVWLDGMEVTQFTYFQQAGGRALDAPAVEITYGLERILMSLQGVGHFKDIRYGEGVTYGELFMQNEYEMSVYNLDEADVAEQRARFDLYDAEVGLVACVLGVCFCVCFCVFVQSPPHKPKSQKNNTHKKNTNKKQK